MASASVTPATLQASVIAVPPLAWTADGTIAVEENRKILDHLRRGGVRTFMYGGNANFYNIGFREFEAALDMMVGFSQPSDWFLPSVGSDFGKAEHQLELLRSYPFPTAMTLPHHFPTTPAGVASGLGRLAERYQKPLIAYIKSDGYLSASDLGALVRDGAICAVKYAVVRKNPREDAYLREIIDAIGTDIVMSGVAERPVVEHFRDFGLRSFTSGGVSVAPGLATALLRALTAGRYDEAELLRTLFLPLEDVRDAISPMRVLHAAVELASVARTGPLQPFVSSLTSKSELDMVKRAALELRANDREAVELAGS